MQTPDLTDEHINKIGKLFPKVITERANEDGKIQKGIDFDLLKQELSKEIVEDGEERYRLDWPGKKSSILKANAPITKTLRPVREDSKDFDNTENVYIEGDNFEVLKILQESYLNKVKMIYIDPPYNTGKDFVYKDNFTKSKEEYEDQLGIENEKGGKLVKNTDTNGRFHSDWLSMMYERLIVARDLLKEDGVIFISIDDNEVHNLRKICDEIFGEENFVGQFKWNRVAKAPSLSNTIRIKYEYINCYKKGQIKKLYGKESYNKQGPVWHNPNKQKELTFAAKSIIIPKSFKKGSKSEKYQVELLDDMIEENGKNKFPVRIKACSAWGQNRINQYIASGNLFEIKAGIGTLYASILKDELNFIAPSDLISKEECGVYNNTDATSELELLGIPFTNPKPSNLIKYLVNMVTYAEKSSIILDFFAGSATTAHAVMQLNVEDGGNRKYIMVQIPEKTEEDSEAYKAGYKNICEIGKERIRRAGEKIKKEEFEKLEKELEELDKESKQKELLKDEDKEEKEKRIEEKIEHIKNLDIGFRVYKVDSTNMKDVYYHPSELKQSTLQDLVSNVKEDRTSEDLLTQLMLDLGLTLDLPVEEQEIKENKIYIVDKNALVACFEDNIDLDIVDDIAKLKPLKVVFKDSSFKDDKDRINVETKFKELSPDTEITVI